jgi:hypothetical protein
VPAFKPVEWRNARTTLAWMVALLVTMFAGIVALDHLYGLVPDGHQTLLSQLAHREFGTGLMYGYVQGATAAVLLLAANTSYNDFPRVLFLLARSYHAPRLFCGSAIALLSATASSSSRSSPRSSTSPSAVAPSH